MPVRESQKCIGARRGIQSDQSFEFLDRLLHFSRHEIALAQGGVKIGPLRSDFQTRFQQRNRVLEIILRHADPGQKKDDVRILRCQLVGARQQIQRIHRSGLLGINLGQQVRGLRRESGFSFSARFKTTSAFCVVAALKISLSQIEENLECFRLQRAGLFQFELGCRVLLFRPPATHPE